MKKIIDVQDGLSRLIDLVMDETDENKKRVMSWAIDEIGRGNARVSREVYDGAIDILTRAFDKLEFKDDKRGLRAVKESHLP